MKRFLTILLSLVLVLSLVACGNGKVNIDYENAAAFEEALNAGEDVTDKIVTFTINKIAPDSVFGYNLQAGENLNFCSTNNPKVKEGDSVTVKVTEVSSMLGSYIINYEMAK